MTITSVSGNVTGASYVGGVFGATYGSRIAIDTASCSISTVVTAGSSSSNVGYCGGVFGYVAGTGAETTNTTLNPGTSTNNFFRFTTSTYTGSFTFTGYGSYVGVNTNIM